MLAIFNPAVAEKLQLNPKYVQAVLQLVDEGATIPFIARYRKDQTGALDEVQITQIIDTAKFEKEFSERKEFIIKTISDQGKMTDELAATIENVQTLPQLEDIYLPYKPKRKTKAQTARENGLEPLALLILAQTQVDIDKEVVGYLNEKVADAAAAYQGVRDIIAELINEDAGIRTRLRNLFEKTAVVSSQILPDKKEEGIKYKDYFEFSEPITKIPSHRILAIMRGFMEGFLRMTVLPEEITALEFIEKAYVKNQTASAQIVIKACRDAYRRLLSPSLETEFRMALKTKADEESIQVFADNLRQLLLSSPLGGKKLLAIDPGYRTGCKVVALSNHGDLLETTVIYVHENNHRLDAAKASVMHLVQKYALEAVAIGDGTAGRETEQFIKKLTLGIPVFLVNEDGASVYSASEIARSEFPDQDITVRGAVSIGRRLMDPLAELVKIDPKSIGVGQYQHDVNQVRLKEKLDQTVESCVNTVGVNLNTAGAQLLSYVSGIGATIAENIVNYRKENGDFKSRKELLKVARLGNKAFEQCAGFLRINNPQHPLDASAVHPERYALVEQIAGDLNISLKELVGNEVKLKSIALQQYVTKDVGLHTLQDIIKELNKPGLDPRETAQAFEFANIYSLDDVQVGMKLPGIITNITKFGVFVDIGVKQDGLVHISEIAHKYITDPSEAVKLNDKVEVIVLEVDKQRSRIALSIKQASGESYKKTAANNKPLKAEKELPPPANIQDALSLLKSKFGK